MDYTQPEGQDQPADFDPLLREGTALLRQGKTSAALPLLERAYALRPEDPDAGMNLSGALILSNKFRRAVEVLEKLRDADPDNAMVWTNLGAAYLGNPVLAREGEQLQAIAAFEKALELDPLAPSVAYNLGLIYRDRRELAEAAAWFRRAAADNPRDHHAQTMLQKMLAGLEEEE